jgi:hypothetical protein
VTPLRLFDYPLGHSATADAGAARGACFVDDDAQKPRPERRAGTKAVERAEGLDERRLCCCRATGMP